MAYKITEDCVGCNVCVNECPTKAISAAGVYIYKIDPEKCTECVGFDSRARCDLACSYGACVPDPAHPETREQLLVKFKRLSSSEPRAVH